MISGLLSWLATGPSGRAALRYGTVALTMIFFLLALQRSHKRTGRLAERRKILEKNNDVQRQMLEAASRCPRDRDDLVERLHDGHF